MTHLIKNTLALLALTLLAAACGDMADPVDQPAEAGASDEIRTTEQRLDFEQGLNFERVEPVLRTVHRCQGCENLHILHLKEGEGGGDDRKKGSRSLSDEVADGNPVPFPVDEKNPTID